MSIKRNYFYNTLINVTNIAIPLISYPYILRILGPSGIGKFNFAMSVMAYFLMFAQLGIPFYGIKEIAKVRDDNEKMSKVFSELFLINLIMAFAIFVFYLVAIIFVDKFNSDFNLFFIVGLNIIASVFTLDWFYGGIESYKYVSLRNLGMKSLYLILIFIVIKKPDQYTYYAALGLITLLLSNTLNMIILLRKVKLNFFNVSMKRHIKPVAFIFLAGFIGSIYNKVDVVLLGFLTEDKYVGLYTVNRKITGLIIVFVSSLGAVLVPRLSYYVNNKMKDEYIRIAEKSINFLYFMSFPAIVFLILMSDEILMFFGDSKFLAGSLSLKLMAFHILFTGITIFISAQVLLANNEEKKLILPSLVGACVNIGINLLFIKHYLHNAPSVAIVVSEFFVIATQLILARKIIKFRMFKTASINYVIGSLFVFICAYSVREMLDANYILVLILSFAASFLIYFTYLYIVKDENVKIIIETIKNRVKKSNKK